MSPTLTKLISQNVSPQQSNTLHSAMHALQDKLPWRMVQPARLDNSSHDSDPLLC